MRYAPRNDTAVVRPKIIFPQPERGFTRCHASGGSIARYPWPGPVDSFRKQSALAALAEQVTAARTKGLEAIQKLANIRKKDALSVFGLFNHGVHGDTERVHVLGK